MRIAIVGAGALGLYYGAPLAYGRMKGIEMPRVEMLATLLEQATL